MRENICGYLEDAYDPIIGVRQSRCGRRGRGYPASEGSVASVGECGSGSRSRGPVARAIQGGTRIQYLNFEYRAVGNSVKVPGAREARQAGPVSR